MKMSRGALLLFALLLAAAPRAQALSTIGDWLAAAPGYPWSFPADHWAHPGYKTEWWYFTGHLVSEEDPELRFGYQFTFFRIGLLPETPQLESQWAATDLIMGHASISDLPTGRHVFSETLYRAVPLLGGFGTAGDSLIAWSRAPAGTEDCWTLSFDGEAFDFRMRDEARGMAFDLSAKPLKPLVFQGPGGFSPKGDEPSAASLYTSFTRMATTGRLEIEGRGYRVKGQSWMDREFGSNQLTEAQVGWDWFSLQLDGGRELMLYHLRDRTGAVDFARGTLVSSDGTTVYLKESDWTLEALDHWESPETEARYPVRWRLRLPAAALDLEIAALMPNQENVSRLTPGLHYWEGAVLVRQAVGSTSGAPVGRGYLELTGYGAGSRPPI